MSLSTPCNIQELSDSRLNVAMTAVIVVGSPRLFEPDCRTPRQMQLANALCHFREKATPMTLGEEKH